jgi:hypothetical protein
LFGPDVGIGGLRLRHSVERGVVGEMDGNVVQVENPGNGPARTDYTGRLGLLLTSPGQHAALGVGMGGGISPAAGSWTSIDAGVLFGGRHRYLRPVLGGWLGYSSPLDHRTFTVATDEASATLRLPHNLFAEFTGGVEIGPPESSTTASRGRPVERTAPPAICSRSSWRSGSGCAYHSNG